MNLKKLFFYPLIFLKCGTLEPRIMRTPVTRHAIALNPADERAFKKIVMDFVRKRESTPMRFWRDHLAHLDHPLCLDIGANYGECFVNGVYPDFECIAIEANPTLIPYLEKTRSMHRDGDHIRLANYLVSDREEENVPFHYSEGWSGGGSAAVKETDSVTIKVPARPLAAIIAEQSRQPFSSLLFKADVEGFEGRALIPLFREMAGTKDMVGILEFDTLMLTAAGTSPREFFALMVEKFQVFLTRRRSTELVRVTTWDDLQKRFPSPNFHCDLAIYSSPELRPGNWHVAPAGS